MDAAEAKSDSLSFVDPNVSRAKFEREIAEFRRHEDDYIRRGWWMVRAEFPEVFVVFGTPALSPPVVAFGALLDFTNYDFWPPSVRLANPFTREPYKAGQLPIPPMPRRTVSTPGPDPQQPQEILVEHLLQFEDAEEVPFLCVPGVREYHEHPAHSGDSWLLRRGRGEGTLYFILNRLGTYGLGAVKGLSAQMRITIQGPSNVLEIPE